VMAAASQLPVNKVMAAPGGKNFTRTLGPHLVECGSETRACAGRR
jgi:hypothetical protein